jgi:predicted alpha-1,6-mannanase (GH76 family)
MTLASLATIACSSGAPREGAAVEPDGGATGATTDASASADGFVPGNAPGQDGAGDASVGSVADATSHPIGDATTGGTADAAIDPVAEAMQTRADDLIETLMLNYWSSLASNTTSYDWKYAHYWDGVLDATQRRGANAFSGTAKMFFDLQQKRGWFDGFYDDENWITLALLHSYTVTGDSTYLDQAKAVYADIEKAWDTTCCGAHPGGLWWEKPMTDKATAINAGAVISGSRLYAATQDSTYLTFAQKVYEFWSTYMVDAATGHVYDSEQNNGSVNTSWSFTYNEGLFIGAVVELSQVTHDASRIPLAHQVASYVMSKEIETTTLGTILSDGKCSGDGEMFKGIAARYIGELYAYDPSHTEYRDFLKRSSDAAWMLARDAASGNISCDWAGPYASATGDVGSLGSGAIGTAAAAKALGPGQQRPALLYEAEEGNLHGVGLEAKYAGFSGWGYVAGWNANGQSVDLLIDVPAAGTYAMNFRYAANGAASRVVLVNGQSVAANVAFPSTGAYTKYSTVSLTAPLPSGKSTVSIAYTSSQGSAGTLNLDSAQLVAQ